jgi:hypothetical protein
MRISLNPQEFHELLLSHHPNYSCFKDDVIILFNKRVCAGCLLGYPIAILSLILLKPSGYESIFFALAFAMLSQFRRITKNLIIQHLCKVVAGIALGFGLGGGYWAFMNREWFAILILIPGAVIYLILRVHSVKRKLKNVKISS